MIDDALEQLLFRSRGPSLVLTVIELAGARIAHVLDDALESKFPCLSAYGER